MNEKWFGIIIPKNECDELCGFAASTMALTYHRFVHPHPDVQVCRVCGRVDFWTERLEDVPISDSMKNTIASYRQNWLFKFGEKIC